MYNEFIRMNKLIGKMDNLSKKIKKLANKIHNDNIELESKLKNLKPKKSETLKMEMNKIIIFGLCMLILINGCNGNKEQSLCIDEECLNLVGNVSFMSRNITAMFIIDCSLPEVYGNGTVEIVYGEAIYNNTNTIEIPFTEFCKRLEPK